MDARGAYTGDKSVRDAAALSEVSELNEKDVLSKVTDAICDQGYCRR